MRTGLMIGLIVLGIVVAVLLGWAALMIRDRVQSSEPVSGA